MVLCVCVFVCSNFAVECMMGTEVFLILVNIITELNLHDDHIQATLHVKC